MRNNGPKLPEGAKVERWEGVEVHPPLEIDVNGCNSCNETAATWWIQVPGLGVRLCSRCYLKLFNLMQKRWRQYCCRTCRGHGYLPEKCPKCNGTGVDLPKEGE